MVELDHVVYFTGKSPVEIVTEQKEVDRHAVVGGSHEKWGTHNALMYAKNAYVEWLAVEHMEIAEKANHPLTEQLLHDGEGWGTICLSVDKIDAFNEDIINKGFRTSGVLKAERKTVNGQIRKWKMLFVNQQVTDQLPMPFFIEWADSDEVRFSKLREDGTILPDNEKIEIKECVFSVNDPAKEAAEWAILLAVEDREQKIVLPNVVLKFIERKGKERLFEVSIGQA